ncbi:MAG TPA: protein kinase [Thermoanaerobaculia bacterium]|nr:protein kinase [Thermoanaerobaculia bacterium]
MATLAVQRMSAHTESGLLRLAIAKGLLRWEDLDSVSDHLPDSFSSGVDDDGSPLNGRWIRALLDAGYLTPGILASLSSELERTGDDLTPDLMVGSSPLSRRPSGRFVRHDVTSPGSAEGLSLAPEYRFLSDWTRYNVERLLGSGGMGTVYKAFDPTLGRYVALKFLHRNDDDQTARFLHEARAQARIAHPHVCQVHEVGEVEGRPYIAMQYIDGRSLGELCEELPLATKVRLIRDVARAVHAAHRNGLIHRDLKPGNILLARDETGDLHPFVVDFGLALEQDESALSRTGMISGTPAYISPEQAQGKTLDRRTDVYSLGVVLYELLAGFPPFKGSNLARILVQLVQEDPKPLRQIDPAIPEDLETLVAKCLEKDPARRYETARDLAEDLDRFLEGDPILARPAGWTYRAGKRLRKNKALAVVSLAAILALAIVGAFSVRQQYRARERAELAQRFGQRIGELESSMAYEAFLPRHDMTPHKRRLRQEMDAIAREMKRLGEIAEGPGNFALGQAFLALHQSATARLHLERAWKAGERDPLVAVALGEALTASYERALGDSSLQASPDNLDRTYRQPALAYLRQAARDPQGAPPPYVAGLIAYLERRYPAALDAARQALLQNPAFFKASQLEAMAILAQGTDATNSGRYEEAQGLFAKAGEVYRRALAQVPSEPGLYAGDCDRWTRWIGSTLAARDVTPEEVARARAACDLALSVDPELADVLILKASIAWRLGDQKIKRGEDAVPDLTEGIALSERAIALDAHDARAFNYLASSYRTLAQRELARGLDPTVHIQKGIAAAHKAVEAQPEMASAHAGLGTAYLVLAQARQRHGADPRLAVEAAAASYHSAIALDPKLIPAHVNLGNAWKTMAEAQVTQGMDPSDSVGNAAAAFQQAVHLNPKYAPAYNNLGNVQLTLGEYLLTRGSDPRQPLADAARSYEQALAIKPDYGLARFNLGYTYRSLAEGLAGQGQDPAPALGAADAALAEYLRLNPNDADTFLEQARVRLAAVRWDLRAKTSPEKDLAEAAADLERAEAVNPKYPDALFAQAQVARYRAEAVADPRKAAAALHDGLARVGRALAINPEEGRYLALRGLLLYRTARLEADPARKKEGARQAVASLQQALKANPLLEREYGSVLADARLDAGMIGAPPVKL